MGPIEISGAVLVILVILVLLIFNKQIAFLLGSVKTAFMGAVSGPNAPEKLSRRSPKDIPRRRAPRDIPRRRIAPNVSRRRMESMADPENDPTNALQEVEEEGYPAGQLPWDEVLQATELDPATHDNHRQFVADVRRFSSGANFTSVADDNTNIAFTNFRGLRRPQHVNIGKDARQQPSIDQTVLQRNKNLRW